MHIHKEEVTQLCHVSLVLGIKLSRLVSQYHLTLKPGQDCTNFNRRQKLNTGLEQCVTNTTAKRQQVVTLFLQQTLTLLYMMNRFVFWPVIMKTAEINWADHLLHHVKHLQFMAAPVPVNEQMTKRQKRENVYAAVFTLPLIYLVQLLDHVIINN